MEAGGAYPRRRTQVVPAVLTRWLGAKHPYPGWTTDQGALRAVISQISAVFRAHLVHRAPGAMLDDLPATPAKARADPRPLILTGA